MACRNKFFKVLNVAIETLNKPHYYCHLHFDIYFGNMCGGCQCAVSEQCTLGNLNNEKRVDTRWPWAIWSVFTFLCVVYLLYGYAQDHSVTEFSSLWVQSVQSHTELMSADVARIERVGWIRDLITACSCLLWVMCFILSWGISLSL